MKRKALTVNPMHAFRAEMRRNADLAALAARLEREMVFVYRTAFQCLHIPAADYARHWELEGPHA